MAALELQWAFGINSNVANCVHLLRNNEENEEMIFYPISNNGVIYNLNTKQQTFLSLHTNLITSSIISEDKELLILGDSGASNDKSIISIWNASNYNLISKYELPQNFGVQTLSINKQNTLLSGIVNESVAAQDGKSNQIIQHLILWSLTLSQTENNSEAYIKIDLLSQHSIEPQTKNVVKDLHHFITFNAFSSEIVTHGENIQNLTFWSIIFADSANENRDEIYPELKPYYFTQDTNETSIDVSSISKLTASLFFPLENGPFITATNSGDLIVWKYENKKKSNHRTINKIITKITRGSINCVSLLPNNNIIALASSSGSVRFYDFAFRVVGWLDYLGDEVISTSFPLNVPKYGDVTNSDAFVVPNMIIATRNNKVLKVESASSPNEETTHYVVMETLNTICSAMASHPLQPIVAIGNKKGEIQMWNIFNKCIQKTISLTSSSSSSSSTSASLPCPQITDILFSHSAQWLVFGTDTHYLRFYRYKNNEYEEEQFFKTSYDGVIQNMCFSFDDEWFALSQSNRISVYRWWYNINDIKREKNKEWTLIGNYVSHRKDIVSLHFNSSPSAMDTAVKRGIPRLFSIGSDNLINEYNLHRSSAGFGLRIKYTFHVKQMSTPTAIQFMCGLNANNDDDLDVDLTPKYDESLKEWKYIEDQLIVFDDELKIHYYHCPRSILNKDGRSMLNTAAERKKDKDENEEEKEEKEEIEPLDFRCTAIGPSYGAPIKKIIRMKNDENTFLFCTYDQVIGLMSAPFNGNPHRYFGCIAHPGNINGFEMINGEYLITNGGYDKSMLVWKISSDILRQQVVECDEANNLNEIYKSLLDDDENKNFYKEIKDYFYYAEIEDGSHKSAPSISGTINIKQITSIFQALSCFLTEHDIERIQKEITYRFHDNVINFDQFIQLFINHRSTFQMSMDSIMKSFQNSFKSDDIQHFMDVLQKKGDKMSRDEIMKCFESLTGYTTKELKCRMPKKVNPLFFAQNILGLKQKQRE